MLRSPNAEVSPLVSSIQTYVDKIINDFFVMLGNGEAPCSVYGRIVLNHIFANPFRLL